MNLPPITEDERQQAGIALLQPGETDRQRMFGDADSGWLWCLHCERAYPQGHYREAHGLQMCAYYDCDGDSVIDAWPWPHREGLPDRPTPGEVYPLYPDDDETI